MRHLSLLAALLLLSGCSDTQPVRSTDGGGGGGGNGSVDAGNDAGADAGRDTGATTCNPDDALGSFAEAYAEAAGRCDVGNTLSRGPLSQQGFANFLRANFAASLEPLIASGRIRWDEPALCAAVATLNSGTCAIDDDGWDFFTGTVPLGSPCSWTEECTDDGWCSFGGSCPGICAQRLAVGDFCSNGAACPEGTTCTIPEGGNNPTCVDEATLYASAGESCTDAAVRCIRGFCDGTICQPYPTLGQSCAATDRCDGGFCDTATGVCRIYLSTGEACSATRNCADGLYCDLSMDLPACKPAQPDGGSCSSPGPSTDCASGICGANRLCTSTLPVRSCEQ